MRACISSSWARWQRCQSAAAAALAKRLEPLTGRLADGWTRYARWVQSRYKPAVDTRFLPAVMDIQERPPSPTARILLKAVCLFTVLALLWAVLGKVDIVAVAEGRTVPTGRVKTIQPLESGRISAIHVTLGQTVAQGEPLVELDVTMTAADERRLAEQHAIAAAEVARLAAMLDGTEPVFPAGTPEDIAADQTRLFREALLQHQATMAGLSQRLTQTGHELDGAKVKLRQLESTLPLIAERAGSYARLAKKGYVARNQSLAMEEQRLQTAFELSQQRTHVDELAARYAAAQEDVAAADAAFRKETLDQLNQRTKDKLALAQDLAKAAERNRQQVLRAPIDGRVHDLKVFTVGGVVTPAQELMKVVPESDALEIEAWLPNKDAGFVAVGQPVRVKLEAFPFTKYGLLEGRVSKISGDAVNDERLGLVYGVTVTVDNPTLKNGPRDAALTPGLVASAEIVTGQRRIIEYFLSPVLQYADESIRER